MTFSLFCAMIVNVKTALWMAEADGCEEKEFLSMEKINVRQSKKRYYGKKTALVILGGLIVGVGVTVFYVPGSILGGGITAISILSHELFGTNVALLTLLCNIPILIFGYFVVDREFMILSTVGMLAMTASMQMAELIPVPTENVLTCIIAGGFVVGGGAGIMLRQNGSGAGTDVICRAIYKYSSFPIGNSSLLVNGILVSLGGVVMGVDVAVATIATIFITGRMVNYIVEGVDYKRTVIIICERAGDISQALMEEFGRGVTITEVTGAYSGQKKVQIMCAITPYQTPKLRSIVLRLEPTAFVTITESISVIGGGFRGNKLDR